METWAEKSDQQWIASKQLEIISKAWSHFKHNCVRFLEWISQFFETFRPYILAHVQTPTSEMSRLEQRNQGAKIMFSKSPPAQTLPHFPQHLFFAERTPLGRNLGDSDSIAHHSSLLHRTVCVLGTTVGDWGLLGVSSALKQGYLSASEYFLLMYFSFFGWKTGDLGKHKDAGGILGDPGGIAAPPPPGWGLWRYACWPHHATEQCSAMCIQSNKRTLGSVPKWCLFPGKGRKAGTAGGDIRVWNESPLLRPLLSGFLSL